MDKEREVRNTRIQFLKLRPEVKLHTRTERGGRETCARGW